MNCMEEFINQCLADVPQGKYRTRTEKELRDHMETLRQSCSEEEVLSLMGNPERLRKEYRAAWQRSWPEQLRTLGRGLAVTAGTHFLIYWVMGSVWQLATSLPGDSRKPWILLIRGTIGNWNNSLFWRHLLPFALALAAGALYMGRRLQTSRRPAALISAGLCLHWSYVTAFNAWWSAIDHHHRPFWEAVARYMFYGAKYHIFTFLLCILIGALFGQKRAGRQKLA